MELRKSLAFFILHAWCQYKTIRGNGWHCFFGSLECSPTRLLLYLPHLLTFLLYIWSHWVVVVVGGGGNPPSAQPTLISIYLKPIFKWNLGRKKHPRRTSHCVCSSKAHLSPIPIAFQCQQTSSWKPSYFLFTWQLWHHCCFDSMCRRTKSRK